MQPDLLSAWWRGLKPEPELKVSEWADRFRILSQASSAEPGPWRTDRAPYLREIMDKLSAQDPVQEVVVIKGAQLGFTEAMVSWLGYIIDVAPGPIMAVMPTEATMKRVSKRRIDPMVESSPRLRLKVASQKSRNKDNTVLDKSFPNGFLMMVGANAGAGLRSTPVRYLLLDEVDSYPSDVEGEGDPIELAKARTRTFARRKLAIGSTPTIEGQSRIQIAYGETDQRVYMVPCPECGTAQQLVWDQMRWETGKPETARYECAHCGHLIEERRKTAMLASGFWQATQPSKASPIKVGYHISSLYSPIGWYSWREAVADYEKAQGKAMQMKVFMNTVLGMCYTEEGEAPQWENLYNRRERYTQGEVPDDVVFLTIGVDVQRNRIEYEVVGWCRRKISYSIEYRVISGDTASPAPWAELDKVVNATWYKANGTGMRMMLMAIDTGYNTSHVYDFCRRYDYTRVIAIKGSDNLGAIISNPKAVETTIAGKKIGKVRVFSVGVSIVKSELYGWLRQQLPAEGPAPDGYCHFPEYDQTYFRGLAAEQLQVKMVGGRPKYVWVKKYERNEPLDCRVYARAAAAQLGMDRWQQADWDLLDGTAQQQPAEAPAPQRRRSGFWDRLV